MRMVAQFLSQKNVHVEFDEEDQEWLTRCFNPVLVLSFLLASLGCVFSLPSPPALPLITCSFNSGWTATSY